MSYSKDFIEEFSNVTFEEKPFGDADALALCEAFYMPIEQVVSSSFDDEPVSFRNACYELFALRGSRDKKLGTMISAESSRILMKMAQSERYSDVRIVAVNEVFSRNPSVQYCAGTLILPDGTLVVCFRGTDDTICGWKEDLDIFTRRSTPSYKLALDYIEALASKSDGRIALCGHSKGGNIALHTAVRCSDSTRARIINVYNNDGPGYYSYDIFGEAGYSQILPGYRHFVPSSSFVGMLMNHDYDYKAVKSSKILGPFQHDVGSWQIENGELVTLDDVDILAKITDEWLGNLMDRMPDEAIEAVDKVMTAMVDAITSKTITEYTKNIIADTKAAIAGIKSVEPEIRECAKTALDGGISALKYAITTVKSGRYNRFSKQPR